jgi:hypothetical protein
LGSTRYGLVKSGKLRVDQLIYRGKLRTIAQLKGLTK